MNCLNSIPHIWTVPYNFESALKILSPSFQSLYEKNPCFGSFKVCLGRRIIVRGLLISQLPACPSQMFLQPIVLAQRHF